MNGMSSAERETSVAKLHKQFGHASSEKLKLLLKDAKVTDSEVLRSVEDVCNSFEICQKYRRTPSRPVVGLSLAKYFNEAVAMDIKIWTKGGRTIYILYLNDVATRFTVAEVLLNKSKEAVINALITKWVGTGPGLPKKFLSDNGGEFNNAEFTDMCENFNVIECKTAAESPWSNGLCEWNHAVVDRMVSKMLEENQKGN